MRGDISPYARVFDRFSRNCREGTPPTSKALRRCWMKPIYRSEIHTVSFFNAALRIDLVSEQPVLLALDALARQRRIRIDSFVLSEIAANTRCHQCASPCGQQKNRVLNHRLSNLERCDVWGRDLSILRFLQVKVY